MGCVLSTPLSRGEYQIRRFKMLHQACGGLKPQYKAMMLMSPEVRYEVERWSMREQLSIEDLMPYLDKNNLSKPKQAEKMESYPDGSYDVPEGRHINCITQDHDQFFYDCKWYEYMLRKLNFTEPYQYRQLDPTTALSEEQANMKCPTRAKTELVFGNFDVLDHPDFNPRTIDFTQRHYDEEW